MNNIKLVDNISFFYYIYIYINNNGNNRKNFK